MNKKLIFTISFFLLILTAPSFAIGVAPGRMVVDFEPNSEKTYEFTIMNNKNEETQVQIYKKGDLTEYITLYDDIITIGPFKSKTLKFKASMPAEIAPGKHDTRIGAREIGGTGNGAGSTVGAVGAVEMQFWTYAPYPGKYLDASLSVPNVAAGETVKFTLILTSRGTESIEKAGATIQVYDSDNMLLTTLDAGSTKVPKDSTSELYAEWDPGKIDAGRYSAKATITYDGATKEASTNFNVGDLFIKITKINAKNIPLGNIGRVTIDIQSFWNEKITGAYATIDLMSNSQVIKTFTGSVFEIPPQAAATTTVFVDTEGLQEKTYTIRVKINYADKSAEETATLSIVAPSAIMQTSLLISAVLVVLIVILIIVILYMRLKKRKHSRPETPLQGPESYHNQQTQSSQEPTNYNEKEEI